MMTEPFETWAPKEIRRLRDEADVLQLAFDRYTGAQGRKSRSSPGPSSNAQPGQPRKSKYEGLFAKWAETSRHAPIDLDAMQRIAKEEGTTFDRNVLRSLVYTQKQQGRVRAEGDGYVWLPPETETASPVQEDAASQ